MRWLNQDHRECRKREADLRAEAAEWRRKYGALRLFLTIKLKELQRAKGTSETRRPDDA